MNLSAMTPAEGLFARRFLLGLRCLVYESQWPGVDSATVPLTERDRVMSEERAAVEAMFQAHDWVGLEERFSAMAGPTAEQLTRLAGDLAAVTPVPA